jgi:hypothetical protein
VKSQVIARLSLFDMLANVLSCGAFRAATAIKTYGAFQDMPHTPTSETPQAQRRHFGAVIAV